MNTRSNILIGTELKRFPQVFRQFDLSGLGCRVGSPNLHHAQELHVSLQTGEWLPKV
jgi:hypothetical protein